MGTRRPAYPSIVMPQPPHRRYSLYMLTYSAGVGSVRCTIVRQTRP